MDLKEKVRQLPSTPGVYLMKDSLNSVIYVGKSKNLKSRVSSYFVNSKSHSPKVVKLVKNLKDFDYILTDTEFEAFMLESKLIKEIKPIYNRKLKCPLSYTYIKIIKDNKFNDIQVSNDADKDDGNLYLGPYTNKNTVERVIQGIKEYYKILCTGDSRRPKACLNYSLGLCLGMCTSTTSKEEYNNILQKVIKQLNGTDESMLEDIKYSMNSAAEKFDFETAAKYRDLISAVNYLINGAKIVEFAEENKYILLLERLSESCTKFFLISGNKVLYSKKLILDNINENQVKSIIKSNILLHFKQESFNNTIEIGREELDEAQIIYSYIKSESNNCRYAIIPETWVNDENEEAINLAISKLL